MYYPYYFPNYYPNVYYTYPVYSVPYYSNSTLIQTNVRPYPEVDPTFFHDSSSAFKQLMQDASHILDSLSSSEELAYQVMDAAQKNQTEKVEELIKSTGVQGEVEVEYNPDGINLTMISNVEGTECCKLTMAIRWR
ncbi:hypothetical protein [Ornithinibacillus halophilus]|uniref:Inner spore coat protein n=1 Tax=Ornithinibacillus halophilus TaxID=930117 RepID=A0A1M5FNZ2_9BACI|nr:hypothetical protein [Ornithinibacillus halophilus]SHF93277.1 hypothetical protein SAMN05216225_100964 [Ornithinibacillus halophilus]